MADSNQVREFTEKLEQGVQDLFSGEKYANYLRTMSRFHKYSTRNTLLIHMQMPTATRVAGFHTWQNQFKRRVKKGEHGIRIFAPVPFTVKEQKERVDPVTKKPILGDDGQPIMEELVKMQSARFKVVPVFDISQTEGEPLPELAEQLTGDVERYELLVEALGKVSPLPILFEDLPEDVDGECRYDNCIAIRNGMSEVQTISAIVHEIAHAKLHDLKVLLENGEGLKDRRTEEVEAESVSYAVCQHYGIETGANSFGYIADWSKTRELKELNASLDTIRKAVAELIDSVDEQLQALTKERENELAAQVSTVPVQVERETGDIMEATAEVHPLIAEYARGSHSLLIGSKVLMMPVFEDGNFNRAGKKIRVTVEPPAGKYQLFSREEHGEVAFYFLTASGRIDRTAQYFRNEWNEETRKWENYRPTEAELDELMLQIAAQFNHDLADPTKWTKYQHAAVVDRLEECEAHNVPVRKLREEEQNKRKALAEQERQAEQAEKRAAYDARVDEIAEAIRNGKVISVGYNENTFDGSNPVLDLFRLYDINIPLRTQGWVNTGLAEITESGYRYYSGRGKGNSAVFSGYLVKLREAIKEKPIAQMREDDNPNTIKKETTKPMERKLYEKLSRLFPDFMNRKFSYLRLESESFEPLSLEWIFGDRLSIMHTYELNGDLCYDPMMVFRVDDTKKTLSAVSFETSIPPLYQYIDDDGVGRSADGNGRQGIVKNLAGELHDFAAQWFCNIEGQGFSPVRGILWNEGRIDEPDVLVTFDSDGKMILPPPESEIESPAAEQAERPVLDPSVPDPSIGQAEMNRYGYEWEGMLPLSQEKAVELYEGNHAVYLLYPDNTEAMAMRRDDIIGHDGLCGIEREDWEKSAVYAALIAKAREENREAELLHGAGNRYGIYQLNRNLDDVREYSFASMRDLEERGLDVDRANYELVYTAPFPERVEFLTDRHPVLNRLYEQFNTNPPSDFIGHSLSVGDVVVLKCGTDITAHYVDRMGFVEIDGFQNRAAHRAADQHEVALPKKQDAQGHTSILSKLEENRQRASANQRQPEKRKSPGLEV